jgi:hypothetical protein
MESFDESFTTAIISFSHEKSIVAKSMATMLNEIRYVSIADKLLLILKV